MYKIARKNVSNMFKLDDLLEYLRRDGRYDIFFASNNFCRRWNFIREKKKKEKKKNTRKTVWYLQSES